MGTPDYMAPEQAQDSRVAHIPADIYSLECTPIFLIAGRPPFTQGCTIVDFPTNGGHSVKGVQSPWEVQQWRERDAPTPLSPLHRKCPPGRLRERLRPSQATRR